MPGPEAESDRLDRRKLAVFARKGPLQPVRVPEEREGADRRVLRLREQLARKLRAAQQQVQAFLLQHGIAEPAGLTRWTAASVDAPRRLELTPEPRLRPDVMLDERQHDRERVARAPRRLPRVAAAARAPIANRSARRRGRRPSRRPGGGSPAMRRRRRDTAGWSPRPATARRPSRDGPASGDPAVAAEPQR
ncbi:IS110 family transposase [Tautonia plasticadhaerens]|uniref:Transposase n=1 Tax=Tautonia plasticadhaerens TaxID=2527974 RepID=A0A518HFD0_9BACT|nr:IS110 family transposase [Tautonia plasticadhaerens]QDV39540.1 Transposase [Tautonia plasticadhaerens]